VDYRVTYNYSFVDKPDEVIYHVVEQLVTDVPANVPRALLPGFIAGLIKHRSPRMSTIRNLRVL
jgi:hypothetical protein